MEVAPLRGSILEFSKWFFLIKNDIFVFTMMKYYFKKKKFQKFDPVAVEKTKTGRFCQNYTFALPQV